MERGREGEVWGGEGGSWRPITLAPQHAGPVDDEPVEPKPQQSLLHLRAARLDVQMVQRHLKPAAKLGCSHDELLRECHDFIQPQMSFR